MTVKSIRANQPQDHKAASAAVEKEDLKIKKEPLSDHITRVHSLKAYAWNQKEALPTESHPKTSINNRNYEIIFRDQVKPKTTEKPKNQIDKEPSTKQF